MCALLKPFVVREQLIDMGVLIFTPRDFQRIFQTDKIRTKYFLGEYTKSGFLLRLKKGLYAMRSDLPPEEEIANLLYQPSYISFEYALNVYNILPEMTYTITSATSKPTRNFEVDGRTFSYFTIKVNAFTGYIPVKRRDRTVLIAEAEKALVDYLYFVSLGKKPKNERLYFSGLDLDKVLHYAAQYQRKGLDLLVKELL
jgi:predicted transcriptional regulator of viral defense system